MHQSGKHAGMSSENLVFENVIYIANKPKSMLNSSGQAIRSTDTLKNVRKCSQLTSDCNDCLWYFQCWSTAEMIDQWWSLTHKGCWLQLQMKFYNNESMKDLTRPVKWKLWASYIIKHNINVLVESVIVLSGNLILFFVHQMHSNWCYWPCACLMLNRFKSPTFKVWSIRMSMILKMSGDPGIPCMKWIWKQDWNSNGLGASNLVLMCSIPLFKFWISLSWGHKATLGGEWILEQKQICQ
jgi:hypothetical protein